MRFLVRKFVHVDPLSVDFDVLCVGRRIGGCRNESALERAEGTVLEYCELNHCWLEGM